MSLEDSRVTWAPESASVEHRAEVVDLDALDGPAADAIARRVPAGVAVGVTAAPDTVDPAVLDALTVTYSARPTDDRRVVTVDDPAAAAAELVTIAAAAPAATAVLCQLVHATEALGVVDALRGESLAYSMLLAGPEFARWRAARPARVPVPPGQVVQVDRIGDVLRVTLDEPARRNPYSAAMRDQLCDALDVALADPELRVELDATGANFCSGGDLTEFGTAPDVVAAHVIRTDRSAGRRLAELADRATVRVHGACVGAGFELPGFAGTVLADPGTTFRLPEIAMGLVPGAGGTVSITRRIGRWRLAHVALTGCTLTAEQALAWGAVDGIA